jgi:hypothetical protein
VNGGRTYVHGAANGVAAGFHRAEIERRLAPKKLEIAIERFELNPGKSDVVRFLNEHSGQ